MARTNQHLVPQAGSKLDNLKFETASEIGITLKPGYNGDLRSAEAGKIGGQMVKKMISFAEQNMR